MTLLYMAVLLGSGMALLVVAYLVVWLAVVAIWLAVIFLGAFLQSFWFSFFKSLDARRLAAADRSVQ